MKTSNSLSKTIKGCRLTDAHFKDVADIIIKYGVRPTKRDLEKYVNIGEYTYAKYIQPLLKQPVYNSALDTTCPVPEIRVFTRLLKASSKSFELLGKEAPAHYKDSQAIKDYYYYPMLQEVIDYVEENGDRDLGYEALIAKLKG